MTKNTVSSMLIALTVLVVGAHFAVAQNTSKVRFAVPTEEFAGAITSPNIHPPSPPSETIVQTFLTEGDYDATVSGGAYTWEDIGTPVHCAYATCTINVTMNANTGLNSTSANNWALCLMVDSSLFDPYGCPYLGNNPTDGSFAAASTTQSIQVARGSHKAAVYVYSDYGVYLGEYQNTYRIFRP